MINTILNNALNRFETYNETFKKVIPTAHAEIENMSYGFHKSFFGDDMDVNAPLTQRTGTYNLICDPNDHEAIVDAIGEEFAKVESVIKVISIEVSRPTVTKWSARKGKAMTTHRKVTLTITWSEDSRITTWKL